MQKALRLLALGIVVLASGACSEARNFGGTGDRALDYVMRADTLETQTLRHVVILAVLASVAAANVPDDEGSRTGLVFRLATASQLVGQLRVISLTPCVGTSQSSCSERSARIPEFERVQARLYRSEIAVAADASPEINLGDFVKSLSSGNPLVVFNAFIGASSQFEALARASTDVFANYRSLQWAKAELYAMLNEDGGAFSKDETTTIKNIRAAVIAKNVNLERLRDLVLALEKQNGFAEKVTYANLASSPANLVQHAYYPWINIIADSCATIMGKTAELSDVCAKARQNLLFAAKATSVNAQNFRDTKGMISALLELTDQSGSTLKLRSPEAKDIIK